MWTHVLYTVSFSYKWVNKVSVNFFAKQSELED